MIRPYRESDTEELVEVWRQASAIAHPFLSERFLEREERRIRQEYLPAVQTWVYDLNVRVVGFISLIGNEVGAIFVHPARQRQGIGSALMDKACSLHEAVELDVFKENEIGRAFYAGYGFEPVEEHMHEETGNLLIRLRYEGG